MTKDYDNYREWMEVEFSEGSYTLNETVEYSLGGLNKILQDGVNRAVNIGLEGCFLRFSSHYEPYEDYLGSPSVTVVGYRKRNESELREVLEQDALENLADELGISLYEARVVQKLKDAGKL